MPIVGSTMESVSRSELPQVHRHAPVISAYTLHTVAGNGDTTLAKTMDSVEGIPT